MGTWNTIGMCQGCSDCCGEVDYDDACDECQEHRDDNCGMPHTHTTPTVPYGTTNKGGSSMGLNTTIASMYEKTADAVLVNKYFGNEIPQNATSQVLYADHADAILAKAQDRQSKDDAQANTVRAQIVN